ncbi:helix-turn-helix domain-containing protein [Clostridium botulinum]|nr:helix-turn-helix domain-containing protein [Clostridium botulinum]NFR13891.1 helix-turn-helix domain-containing protein [Clostridium botulinum]NFR42520.1 helix-turn-helix domain-containing protein [Clostridium botulinum]NFS49432.1 helix-turn-helix domain-containing protein [Clostridium botulinum]
MIKNLLSEEQSNMIDYLIEGKSISDISRILNKSRSTIYKWIELDQVKEEIEIRRTEIKKQARSKIAVKVGGCIDNLIEIANTSKDIRTKFQANKYLVDQFLGSPTSKQEEEQKNEDKVIIVDIDEMLEEIKQDNA